MKTHIRVGQLLLLLAGLGFATGPLRAQYIAYEVPDGTLGNHGLSGIGVGNDFQVNQPITITELGVFANGTNGLAGGTELTVQLYERGGNNGTLLESLSFDAASPGIRMGGSYFKPLANPVTLLPGSYTISAHGFDTNSPAGDADLDPYNTTPWPWKINTTVPPWTVNTGGGLIQPEGLSRHGASGFFPGHLDRGPANRYAAGTFKYQAATLPVPPYAADYAALTAGVANFPIDDLRHLGSIAVLDNGAFPVLVEHGGNREVLEAAGTYNGDPKGGRAVVFAHTQWERSFNDSRLALFENAILWASRKSNPAEIVIGVTTHAGDPITNMNIGYFASRGYQIIPIDCKTWDLTNALPAMDVLIVDGHTSYAERIGELIQKYAAEGGGLVVSVTPRFVVYPKVRPVFNALNQMLQPYALAYRSSLAVPVDLTLTNIQTVPHPDYFIAFPAAEQLHADKIGQRKLDSQQKVIAFNTISYAVVGQPQWLAQLTAVYAGTTNNGIQYPGDAGDLVDVVTLNGAQATTNQLGRWTVEGQELVAQTVRGMVEYAFNVPASDLYQLRITGASNPLNLPGGDFNLKLTIDGQSLGHFDLNAETNNGTVQCRLPFLTTGPHTLRILCDDPGVGNTTLRLQAVKIQTRLGPDSDGSGVKDWVKQMLQQESGLDNTNATISSYTSPLCLEGRDPYLKMMSLYVEGADNKQVNLTPQGAPNQRWYVNVPLSAYVNAEPIFHASYQNGGGSDLRYLQWLPVNLLAPPAASLTVRQGDSLLFNAAPTNAATGSLVITIGTNQWTGRSSQPIACPFNQPGSFSVTGTYSRAGLTQSGGITVTVVGQSFSNHPDCWVGNERPWNIYGVPPQAGLESDARLFFAPVAALANQGEQIDLVADQNEPRFVLARLGTNGPVLNSARVNGFQLWSANSTGAKILQVYPDGSQLVETKEVLSPVPSDLTVRLDVLVGGVIFDDGTTSRTLTPADFDALGQSVVRFIRPASARTSTCYSITVLQGANQIFYTR